MTCYNMSNFEVSKVWSLFFVWWPNQRRPSPKQKKFGCTHNKLNT
jgi:hypothetical protein